MFESANSLQQQGVLQQLGPLQQQGLLQQMSAIWPSGAVPRDYIQDAIDSGLARPAEPPSYVPNYIQKLEGKVAELKVEILRLQARIAELEPAAPEPKGFPARALGAHRQDIGLRTNA